MIFFLSKGLIQNSKTENKFLIDPENNYVKFQNDWKINAHFREITIELKVRTRT